MSFRVQGMSLGAVFLAWVVGVSDGDTLLVRPEGAPPHKVRVAYIDAPEHEQPFGTAARKALSSLCFKRNAQINPINLDRYGRVVAEVKCAGTDVATAQVSAGMAWVYPAYAPKQSALYGLEETARLNRQGLWRDAKPTPPWRWRRQQP